MRKKDKQRILIATGITIVFGAIVLAVVVWHDRKLQRVKPKKLKDLVKEDLKFWSGIRETDRRGAEKIAQYWKLIGWNFSTNQVMSPSFQNKYFWSAIYISDLMNRWGAGDRFQYSSSHADYIIAGKKAKQEKDPDAIFWSYAPNQAKVEVGDLVGLARKSGLTYDNIYKGAPTHTDLVYDIEKTSDGYIAHAVGGNVSNTVKSTKIHLDSSKRLKNPSKYLTVMKNQDV